MQAEMTSTVQNDISSMVKNQLKRKEEAKNLKEAERKVKEHNATIETLLVKNKTAKNTLNDSQNKLVDMRQFTEFLDGVAKEIDKDMGNTGSEIDVNKIQQRFKNLQKENTKLKQRKVTINNEIEQINAQTRETMKKLEQ